MKNILALTLSFLAFLVSINMNAQWDFTLNDALNELMYASETNNNDPCCAMSGYAFQGFNMEQLDDENSMYTVFVPTQEAVEGVLELLNLNMWDGLNFSDMVPALNYHIVPGTYMAADLEDGMSLLTLEGQSLIVSIGSGVRVDEANVIQTDIIADNGVIHVIDATLAPAGYPEATVVQVVVQSDDHTSFAQGITNAYLTDYLSAQALEADDDNNGDPLPGPFTVFAPTDDAINTFAATYGYVDVQSFLTSQYVDEFIERHIVIGNYMSTDLSDGQTLTSLSGEPVTLSIGVDGIQASGAEVEVADLLAYNGVVHSIGSVLPFDIPTVEGTCGTWTINLYNASDWEDWGGSTVDIYVDGIMIASETNNELAIDEDFNGIPEALGTSTFSFAVNEGSVIDVLFTDTNGSGWPSYEVLDENGNVLFETVDDTNFGAGSVFGLKPCDTDFSCGYVEILFIDESQEGWIGGALEVFSYEYGMYATIDFNPFGTYAPSFQSFWQRKAFVPVNTGEIGFAVLQPLINAEACGYSVYGPSGELLVDQSSEFLAPESVEGIAACAVGDDAQCNAEFQVAQATTPNGTPIAGAVDVIIFDYNINATYAWDFGDEGTSDDPFPIHAYNTDGPYTLCLTVTDADAGCSETYCEAISVDSLGLLEGFIDGFVITVINGGESGSANAVGELNAYFSQAKIYPNPAADWLAISGCDPNLVWTASLINLTGQVVKKYNGTGASSLDVSDITSGLYQLQFTHENSTTKTFRVVIE
mgnify:FL=1